MHEKDSLITKWKEMDKSFYMILLLCLAAIGISGYVLFFLPMSETPDADLSLDPGLPSASVPDTAPMPEIPDVTVQLEPEVIQTPEPAPAVSAAAETIPAKTAPQPDADEGDLTETWIFHRDPAYVWPVSGEMLRPYSEKLVYDETMGDWRTHNGIDLACAPDDPVLAMAEGVVSAIEEDPLRGTVIRITHGDLEAAYAGLSSQLQVTPGDTIEKGQTIGTAGHNIKSESLLPCHIHLEVTREGRLIDPDELKWE